MSITQVSFGQPPSRRSTQETPGAFFRLRSEPEPLVTCDDCGRDVPESAILFDRPATMCRGCVEQFLAEAPDAEGAGEVVVLFPAEAA